MGEKWVYLILVCTFCCSTSAELEGSSNENPNDKCFLSELRAMCLAKTGSNDTYEKLSATLEDSPFCLMGKINVERISTGADPFSEPTRVEFFTKYCPQMRDSLTCASAIADKVRKCLDPIGAEVLDIAINKLPEAINFVCRDHGRVLFTDEVCLSHFAVYATKCLEHLSNATGDRNHGEQECRELFPTYASKCLKGLSLDLSSYGQEQCRELSEARECFAADHNGCSGRKLLGLFDLFYRPVVQTGPCKEFIKLEDLSATEATTS